MDRKAFKKFDPLLKEIYGQISLNDFKAAEDLVINKFNNNFLFETFFYKYLNENKYGYENVKRKLASEVVDALLYNEGKITFDELFDVINYKKPREIVIDNTPIDLPLEVEVNGNILDDINDLDKECKIITEQNSNFEYKLNIKEENPDEDKRRNKTRGFFLKRNR